MGQEYLSCDRCGLTIHVAAALERYHVVDNETQEPESRDADPSPSDCDASDLADEGEATKQAPPSLAVIWRESLGSFLDPNPFLLRPSEAGMGLDLDRLLGGGLSVGQTVALVSHGAGAGKTSLLHQWADGIGAASAISLVDEALVVPVVFVSEMTTRDLTLRSLARQAGVEGYLLRDPQGALGSRHLAGGKSHGQHSLELARAAAEHFEPVARLVTPIDRRTRVTLADLSELVRRVRVRWTSDGVDVPAVVVLVDPLHRLLDPTRPEVEGIGLALTGLLDLAQREDAIVLFTSDTTRYAAASRGTVSKLGRAEELALAVEMAFRGSYQLLHLPDVALGLITMRADDEGIDPDTGARLGQEPAGTLYAELASAKSRWEGRGLRAPYWYDPALFRFRPTVSRTLPRELSLEERVLEFVARCPACSQAAVKREVPGRGATIQAIVQKLLRDGKIVDEGDSSTGMALHIPRNTAWHKGGTGPEQPLEQVGPQEPVPEGSPLRGESPPSGTGLAPGSETEDGCDLGDRTGDGG